MIGRRGSGGGALRPPARDAGRRWLGRAALAALALVLVACETAPTEGPVVTPTPEPTPTTTTYQLDTTVWYAGFVMTFGSATAVLDARGGTVAVELRLENPGQDDLSLDTPIRLTVGTTSIEPTRETVLPSVGAGSSGYTTLTYQLIGVASVDNAILRIGGPDRHQGIVAFSAGGVASVSLEPVDLKLKGTATAGDFRLVLSEGLLRWDLPDWADELPADSASLTLTYDVTYIGTFSGGAPFTGDNIELLLPDGTVLRARADGRSQSVGVILPGKTLKRLSTRFEIPAGLAGTYTLVLGSNGKQAKIKLKLPG